ncbi:hypothetical protein [Crenobacter cavernae]|uniref:PH domain-containing protein n=1 Tax=Crenobacter cavernae TaxID=2290923 RepID=A0A345Y9V2_9NEIS|nr:hypothetical protein [Crenobacter cavernae]AXK40704.1 hypothetical protein DWG20_15465 [Crenobacter cavernae]
MPMSAPSLPDPRQYSAVPPSNDILRQTSAILAAATADEREMWVSSLKSSLADRLSVEDMVPISVALAMVDSEAAYRTLWQSLGEALDGDIVVFAMPVVLVAGSKGAACLSGELADVEGLATLVAKVGLVNDASRVTWLPQLLHPDTLAGVKSARLYRLANGSPDAARDALAVLPAAPVALSGEGVFLRYLVGVAERGADGSLPLSLSGSVGAWGMPLMQWLNTALKTEGVTLFSMPRVPQALTAALVAGGQARHEVAMQVFASNRIRKLRELSLTPVAIASAHEGGELRFTLSASGDVKNWEGFVWPLSPLDSVPLIASQFAELMADCRVDDVRFVPQLAADKDGDVPVFFTADDLPPAGAALQ